MVSLSYNIHLKRIPQLESRKPLSDKTCEELHYAVISFHQDFPIKAQANHIDLGNDAPPKIMASNIVVKQLGVLRMVTACRFLRKPFLRIVKCLKTSNNVCIVFPPRITHWIESLQHINPFAADNVALQGKVVGSIVREIVQPSRVESSVQITLGGIFTRQSLNPKFQRAIMSQNAS